MQDHNKRTIGNEVEQSALDYLMARGLKHRDSNYHAKTGEIDLIMEEDNILVFVEVRFRDSRDFGGALASVSRSKQNKIIRTAKLYLLEQELYDKVYCRFDIVTGEFINEDFVIQWYKNAFTENFL